MCSILNIIGKCQCLFIIIKLRCKHLRNACTNLCCTAKTHQCKTSTTSTARAIILLMILRTRSSKRIRNHNVNHLNTAINTLIRTFLTKFYLQTIRTNLCKNHSRDSLIMSMWKHHHDLFICAKIQIIKRFQIRHGCIVALIEYGYPTSNATITTVYNRKILL